MKGQDWHVELDNYETARIDKNDFSFKVNGKTVWFDYAYITIHGTPGENGYLQGYFALIGLPYSTSNVLIEALTFDKYILESSYAYIEMSAFPSPVHLHCEKMHDKISEYTSKGIQVYLMHLDNEKKIAEYIREQLQEDMVEDQISLKEFVDPFTGEKNTKA